MSNRALRIGDRVVERLAREWDVSARAITQVMNPCEIVEAFGAMRKKKIETRGRKKQPAGEKQGSRAICHLDADDRAALKAHAEKSRQSESAILRAALVLLGVLPAEQDERELRASNEALARKASDLETKLAAVEAECDRLRVVCNARAGIVRDLADVLTDGASAKVKENV
jgi:hypothetical protein